MTKIKKAVSRSYEKKVEGKKNTMMIRRKGISDQEVGC